MEGGDLGLGGGGVTDVPQEDEEVHLSRGQGGLGGGHGVAVGIGQDVGLHVALGGDGGKGVLVGLGGTRLGVVVAVIRQGGDMDAVGAGIIQQGHGHLDLVDVGIGAHDAVDVIRKGLAAHDHRGHGGLVAEEDDLVILLHEEYAGVAGKGHRLNGIDGGGGGVHVTPPYRWADPCRG